MQTNSQKQDGDHIPSQQVVHEHHKLITSRVTDHLANERTFLAWLRTALAIMALGFAVERIGLALRDLGLKSPDVPSSPIHYSTLVGVTLVFLGVLVLIFALINFLTIRAAIEKNDFHPQAKFSIMLTVLTGVIGLILVVYLIVSG